VPNSDAIYWEGEKKKTEDFFHLSAVIAAVWFFPDTFPPASWAFQAGSDLVEVQRNVRIVRY